MDKLVKYPIEAVPGSANVCRDDRRVWLSADQGKYVPEGTVCGKLLAHQQ